MLKTIMKCLLILLGVSSSAFSDLRVDYTFDEGAGLHIANQITSKDKFGNVSTGKISSENLWEDLLISPWRGSGLKISNIGDVAVVDLPSSISEANAFTVSLWLKLDEQITPKRRVVINREESWRISIDTNHRIQFQLNINGVWAQNWTTGSTVLDPGQWYHITAIWDGNRRFLFLNGSEENLRYKGNDYPGIFVPEGKLGLVYSKAEIGNSENGEDPLVGTIDNLKIWDHVLTQPEINAAINDRPYLSFNFDMDGGEGINSRNSVNGLDVGILSDESLWYAPGHESRSAIHLEEDGEYFRISNDDIGTLDNAMTFSAWIKLSPNSNSTRRFIANKEGSWRIFFQNNKTYFQQNIGGWAQNWLISSKVLTEDTWHYIAVVWNGSSRGIFINGELEAELINGELTENNNDLIIGNAETGAALALDGTIDNVQLWNRALSQEELISDYKIHASKPILVLEQGVLQPGTNPTLRIINRSDVSLTGNIAVWLDGVEIAQTGIPNSITVSANDEVTIPLIVPVLSGQEHAIEIGWSSLQSLAQETVFQGALWVTPQWNQATDAISNNNFIMLSGQTISIDCDEYDNESYCINPDRFRYYTEEGDSSYLPHLVESYLGNYLELGGKRFSRAAFHFSLMNGEAPYNEGVPYLLKVNYPDDEERTAEIITWSNHPSDQENAQTGYLTGTPYPISNEIKVLEFVIYPREPELALVFMTAENNKPAAIQKIEIYKINTLDGNLPSANIIAEQRHIGLYYEDTLLAKNFGGEEDGSLSGFQKVVDNMVYYMDYTGQNLLSYPLVWYKGPLYQSSLEDPYVDKGSIRHPRNDFFEMILQRFDQTNKKAMAILNVHQLPSLVRQMNANEQSVIDTLDTEGENSFNLVLGQPVKCGGEILDAVVLDESCNNEPPLFNILHPVVQQAFSGIITEIAERYKGHASFKGIVFHMPERSQLWLGSLKGGYSDWMINEFNEENPSWAIALGQAGDSQRFKTYYAQLNDSGRKEAWINWRCSRLSSFYRLLLDIIKEKDASLKLVLELHSPPNGHFKDDLDEWKDEQGGDVKSAEEFFREAGICMEMLNEEHNPEFAGLTIQKVLFPQGYRILKATKGLSDISALRSRELDFSEQLSAFNINKEFGVVMHQSYWESDVGKKNKKPMDDLWWTSTGQSIPWRSSTLTAAGRNYLDYYTHSWSSFNADEVLAGGFILGTVGHEEHIREFASVYRILPSSQYNWQAASEDEDVVHMRYLNDDNAGYGWLVLTNRTPAEQPASLWFNSTPNTIIKMPTEEMLVPNENNYLTFMLKPYELVAIKLDVGIAAQINLMPDEDRDGYPDLFDNCPGIINPNQSDKDKDEIGNVCDVESVAVYSSGSEDGWVRESGEETNMGGSIDNSGAANQAIRIGDDSNKRQYKSLLSFSVESYLPLGAKINAASLHLKGLHIRGVPFDLGNIQIDISPTGFSGNPDLELEDFQGVAALPNITSLMLSETEASSLLPASLYNMLETSVVVQLRLAYTFDDNNNNETDYLGFYSGSASNIENRPSLILEYMLPD